MSNVFERAISKIGNKVSLEISGARIDDVRCFLEPLRARHRLYAHVDMSNFKNEDFVNNEYFLYVGTSNLKIKNGDFVFNKSQKLTVIDSGEELIPDGSYVWAILSSPKR